MRMKTLTKAVAVALIGGSVGAWQPASATTTMYNTFVGASDSDTDGWNYGGIGNPTFPIPNPGWVGVTGSTTGLPFNYGSGSWLNWAIDITTTGSWEISKADAATKYGASVDLDTNKGAYHDFNASGFGKPQGWAHNTDIGLLKNSTAIPLDITLTIVNDETNPAFSNFGMTIFQGIPTTSAPNHHASWNCPTCTPPLLFTSNTPFGLGGLTYVAHTDVLASQFNTLTFTAAPGQIYSIFLGGATAGSVFFPTNDYKVDISAVPVPAALWLFGGALVGWARLRRSA